MAVALPGNQIKPRQAVGLAHELAVDHCVLLVRQLPDLLAGEAALARRALGELPAQLAWRSLHEHPVFALVRADGGLDHHIAQPQRVGGLLNRHVKLRHLLAGLVALVGEEGIREALAPLGLRLEDPGAAVSVGDGLDGIDAALSQRLGGDHPRVVQRGIDVRVVHAIHPRLDQRGDLHLALEDRPQRAGGEELLLVQAVDALLHGDELLGLGDQAVAFHDLAMQPHVFAVSGGVVLVGGNQLRQRLAELREQLVRDGSPLLRGQGLQLGAQPRKVVVQIEDIRALREGFQLVQDCAAVDLRALGGRLAQLRGALVRRLVDEFLGRAIEPFAQFQRVRQLRRDQLEQRPELRLENARGVRRRQHALGKPSHRRATDALADIRELAADIAQQLTGVALHGGSEPAGSNTALPLDLRHEV